MTAKKVRPKYGDLVVAGMSARDVAAAIGISTGELYRWMQLSAVPPSDFEAAVARYTPAQGAALDRAENRQHVPRLGHVSDAPGEMLPALRQADRGCAMTPIPDPFPDLATFLQALVDADAAGATTEQHLVDAWWALAPVRSRFPGDMGYRVTRAIENRLSDDTRRELRRHVDDLVSARIAEAIDAGLPVFEPGGLLALAEADLAIGRAAR